MADPKNVHLVGIVGSSSPTSVNARLMHAVAELVPAHTTFALADLRGIPVYDDEVAKRDGMPPAAETLRQAAASADAFVFATPEYNYSIPSLLKAALEWASRPPSPPFSGKPAAIVGATPSPHGTVRAQGHLRQICVSLNMFPVNVPHIDVVDASKQFENGLLVDPATRSAIKTLLEELRRVALALKA